MINCGFFGWYRKKHVVYSLKNQQFSAKLKIFFIACFDSFKFKWLKESQLAKKNFLSLFYTIFRDHSKSTSRFEGADIPDKTLLKMAKTIQMSGPDLRGFKKFRFFSDVLCEWPLNGHEDLMKLSGTKNILFLSC